MAEANGRRLVIVAVIAALLGVAVWWIAGAVRSSSKPKTVASSSDGGAAVVGRDQEVEHHGIWHTARQTSEIKNADPEGDIRLEGQVIDANQQPVGGAAVVLDSKPPRIVESEADGSFAFDGLLARSYWVNAYKDDLRGDAQRIRVRADVEPVIIRMYEGMSVVITVIDRDTRAPIVGAEVTTGQLLEQTVTTDDNGRAELRGLPPGPNFASVEADGYAPGYEGLRLPEDPGGRIDRTVELGRGASVSGVVLGPDGTGLADSEVYGSNADGYVRTETMADGSWTIPAVSAGVWVFSCPGEQWAPGSSEPVTLDGKTPVDGVEIHLEAGARIAGVVVDATGAVVPGATVTAAPEADSPGNAVSKEDGSFEILGLPRTNYMVVASEGDRASEQLTADVRVSDVGDLRVTITEATISGVVVDASGEPVAEAEITARPEAMTRFYFQDDTMTITDSAGRWTIGPVSGQDYDVFASWPGNKSADRRGTYGRDDGTKAKRGDRDVKLVLPEAATLRGVVTRGGAPLTRYAIGVSQRRNPAQSTPKLVASADGKFERQGLVPGTYAITIAGDDFATKTMSSIELKAGEITDLGTIEVEAGRTIRGVVVDASGAPVGDAVVAISGFFHASADGLGLDEDPLQNAMRSSRQTRSSADGRFELRGISTEGKRGLSLLADKARVGRSKEMPLPATDAELTVTLLATGAIAVAIEGASGDDLSVSATLVGGGGSSREYGGATLVLGGLIPGTYEVLAEQMMQMRKAPKVTVEVKAGETAAATVRFPTGGVTIVVEPGDECQMVMLLTGHVEEFNPDAMAATAMCSPNTPVEIENIQPGDYRLCLMAECTPITVKPSPDRQTFTAK